MNKDGSSLPDLREQAPAGTHACLVLSCEIERYWVNMSTAFTLMKHTLNTGKGLRRVLSIPIFTQE